MGQRHRPKAIPWAAQDAGSSPAHHTQSKIGSHLKIFLLLVVFVTAPVLYTLGVLGSWRSVRAFWMIWLRVVGVMALFGLVLASLTV